MEEIVMEVALDRARRIINTRALQAGQYVRGYNDCFAFLLEYERALRGDASLSKDINITYNDEVEFMTEITNLGYESLEAFTIAMGFELVANREPATGDIAFETIQGQSTAMIAETNYWFSTHESNKGVRPRRKQIFKEINLTIHARPIDLGT